MIGEERAVRPPMGTRSRPARRLLDVLSLSAALALLLRLGRGNHADAWTVGLAAVTAAGLIIGIVAAAVLRRSADRVPPGGQDGSATSGLEADELRDGLAAGQLVAHYQPIVRIGDGALVGVEALARWHHPTRGLLEPAEFIALAEAGGLLGVLGTEMLAQGTANAARWMVRADSAVSVAVNVAPGQLADPGFVAVVRAALTDAGVPSDTLCLEIIEGAMVADEAAAALLDELDQLGALTICLDDFGTGHSSLGRLKRFPVHQVKIDRSFVAHVTDDGVDRAIASAIIELAHALGLTVVAEGVETKAQLCALHDLGCDLAQGWLFARAMPAVAIDALVPEASTAYSYLSCAGMPA